MVHTAHRALVAKLMLVGLTACRSSSEDERVCERIGTNGGIVTSTDQVLSLSLRPSALTETVEVCIELAERPPSGPPAVYGQAYRVTPDIDLFVALSATYQAPLPEDTSETAVGVIRRADFEAGEGRWLSLPTSRLEPENDLIAGTDNRISMYYGLLDDGGSGMVDPTVTTADSDPSGGTTAGSNNTADPASTGNGTDTDNSSDSTDSASASNGNPTNGGTDTGTVQVDCDNLAAPPFETTLIATLTPGNSEDLAMTGQGTFVLADGNALVEMDGTGTASPWSTATLPFDQGMLGLSFDSSGTLFAATGINSGDVWAFTPSSSEVYLEADLDLGNGIFVDSQGRAWISAFFGDNISRIAPGDPPTLEVVLAQNTNEANGVFFDETRSMLFWTLFGPGQLWRAPVDVAGVVGTPVPLADLDGNSDGVTMDECGNLYVVDQAGVSGINPCRIDRVVIDEVGDLVAVEEIAAAGTLGNGCANAQFGFGFGNAYDQSLFVTGAAGNVYRVAAEVGGYPVVLPPG